MKSTVDSLVGKLFITGLPGLAVDADFASHYDRCPCGGFILFGRNAHDLMQVRKLTGALADLALARGADWGPPLIAVDQEGGTLSPLKRIVTSLPGNMGLAATGDLRTVARAGYITGRDLLSLGITINFAPVLDLALEPLNPAVGTRSFGDDPHRVAEYGAAYAKGLLEAGVLFVAKHFPGHGGVSDDSHFSLPECSASKADLLARDVIPFIEAMKLPCAAMMMAHIKFTSMDSLRPASLSYPLVTGFLREELGFDGVVLTDCLEMIGAQGAGTVPEAAVMAIEAGCDITLVSHTPALQEAAYAAVRDAVLSGRISLERVERSVARIKRWKNGLAAHVTSRVETALDLSLDDLGERVVTFVGGDSSRPWRFGPGALVLVTPAMERITVAEDAIDVRPLAHELESRGVRCAMVSCAMDPDAREIGVIMEEIEAAWRALTVTDVDGGGTTADATLHPESSRSGDGKPRVALVVRSGGGASGQAALAAAIEARWNLLLISIRDPRETRLVEAGLTHRAPAVFTYSTERVVLSALARVLAGEAGPKGVMPVRI
ncbi:MAG: beta-N-acetylhexosaminidase [Bacteroidota bacterium]